MRKNGSSTSYIGQKKNVHFAYRWINVIHDLIVFHEHVHIMMKISTTRYMYAKPKLGGLGGCRPGPQCIIVSVLNYEILLLLLK